MESLLGDVLIGQAALQCAREKGKDGDWSLVAQIASSHPLYMRDTLPTPRECEQAAEKVFSHGSRTLKDMEFAVALKVRDFVSTSIGHVEKSHHRRRKDKVSSVLQYLEKWCEDVSEESEDEAAEDRSKQIDAKSEEDDEPAAKEVKTGEVSESDASETKETVSASEDQPDNDRIELDSRASDEAASPKHDNQKESEDSDNSSEQAGEDSLWQAESLERIAKLTRLPSMPRRSLVVKSGVRTLAKVEEDISNGLITDNQDLAERVYECLADIVMSRPYSEASEAVEAVEAVFGAFVPLPATPSGRKRRR